MRNIFKTLLSPSFRGLSLISTASVIFVYSFYRVTVSASTGSICLYSGSPYTCGLYSDAYGDGVSVDNGICIGVRLVFDIS